MENVDYTDVFQKACLIQLSTSVWQGCCKLDKRVLKRIGENSDWLKGSKDLVNQELLGPVRKIAGQARTELIKHSLPFPINSVYLISNETRELAISALREEFGKIVNGLADKLNKDGAKPKVIKSSMFNKMREFLDDFGTRNIFEDNVLVELSDQVRDLIEGVSTDGVKPNDIMIQRIKNEMNQLKSAIDGAIEDMPRRKIRMAV